MSDAEAVAFEGCEHHFQALFSETNPLPVKTALAHLGWIEEEFRLPLCRMQATTRAALVEVVDACAPTRHA